MSEQFNISSSPHIRSKVTTSNIMMLVTIALLPTTIFGVYNFGLSALGVVLITTGTAVLTEYLYQKLMHKKVTIQDFSAVVTGLLLALNLPPTAPWWMCVLGSVFAILVVKQLFGGLGQNFMNPALGARCFLLISFTGRMTTFVYDGVSGATPLAQLKAGESVIFIILFGGHGLDPQYITAHLCGGGLMLGAWFMATDYVTSPITKKGQIVYGVCLGLLTGLFRLFGGSAEGVSYAIIFSNLLVPLIEKVTLPKPFGKGGEK